jgi:hypothetical protein
MFLVLAAIAAASAICPPAPAKAPVEPQLTNFADDAFRGAVGKQAPKLPIDFAAGAKLGDTPLIFEKTKLDDLARQLNAPLHTEGQGREGVTWLCVTSSAGGDKPRTLWLASSNGLAPGRTLSMVAEQNIDASQEDGCAPAPAGFAFPTYSVPGLGATLTDLEQSFKFAKRQKATDIYYASIRPAPKGSSTLQSLGYRLSDEGVVTGFALLQETTT